RSLCCRRIPCRWRASKLSRSYASWRLSTTRMTCAKHTPISTFPKTSWRPWRPSAAHRCCARLAALPYCRGQLRYAVPSLAGDLPYALEDSMRVLGIDPGSVITGFGVVEEARGNLRDLAWGAVRLSAPQPLPMRFQSIYNGLSCVVCT